jgi:O-antigen ligase
MLVLFILFWFFVYPVRGTIVNYVTGNTFFGRSAWNGLLSNPNYLAATCLVPISSAAALMALWRRKLVVAAGSIVLATLVGVMILTQSRAGMLALFVFTAIAVAGSRKRGKAIAASLGLAIIVLAVAPPEAWERLSGLTKLGGRRTDWRSVDEEGSAEQRFQIAQTALTIIGDHPLGGTGSGTYPIMNERYNPMLGPRDTHNTYLHVTAEQGFIGLALFLGMLLSVARYALVRATRLMESAPHGAGAIRLLAAGLASFLVAGIWGSYDNFQILYVLCLLLYLSARLAGPDLVRSSGRGAAERTPRVKPPRSAVAPRR